MKEEGPAVMYLVERYAPPGHAAFAERWPGIEGVGATGLRSPDGGVRHVFTALIPGDELRLSLFEAPSGEALGRALAARGLPFTRIVVAVIEVGDLVVARLTREEAPWPKGSDR